MSKKALISRSVSLAFKQLGDLLQDVEYTAAGVFNAANGTMTATTPQPAKAVITLFHRKEIDGSVVMATDRKAIFEVAELTFTMKVGGAITVNSQRYKIVDIMQDPAGATLTVQLRR